MHRRQRFLVIGAAPLVAIAAAGALGACGERDSTLGLEYTADAAPDVVASSREAEAPLEDGGAVDARTPFDPSDEPVTCTAKPCVTQLVGGGQRFCALLEDQTVRCWGSGYVALGTLDGGPSPDQPRPISMGLSGVTQLSASYITTCARLIDGTVKCWGGNYANELGLDPPGSDYRPHDPEPVMFDGGALDGVTRVDVGRYGVVFATKGSGELWSWGANAQDVLGRANETARYLGAGRTDFTDLKVGRAGGTAAEGYGGIGFAVTEGRQLLTWGTSRQMVAYPGSIPMVVAGLENVGSAAASFSRVCAVADGRLYCWGSDGLLACTGSADAALSPVEIKTRGTGRAQQVALDDYNTCVRLTDGTVQCCGADALGQLGTGSTDAGASQARLLTEAKALEGHAVQIAVGIRATCALLKDGTVKCWGGNESGELGQGTMDGAPHPTPATVTFD